MQLSQRSDLGRVLGVMTRDAREARRKEEARVQAEEERVRAAEAAEKARAERAKLVAEHGEKFFQKICEQAELGASKGVNQAVAGIAKILTDDAIDTEVMAWMLTVLNASEGCHAVELQDDEVDSVPYMMLRLTWNVAEPEAVEEPPEVQRIVVNAPASALTDALQGDPSK